MPLFLLLLAVLFYVKRPPRRHALASLVMCCAAVMLAVATLPRYSPAADHAGPPSTRYLEAFAMK